MLVMFCDCILHGWDFIALKGYMIKGILPKLHISLNWMNVYYRLYLFNLCGNDYRWWDSLWWNALLKTHWGLHTWLCLHEKKSLYICCGMNLICAFELLMCNFVILVPAGDGGRGHYWCISTTDGRSLFLSGTWTLWRTSTPFFFLSML